MPQRALLVPNKHNGIKTRRGEYLKEKNILTLGEQRIYRYKYKETIEYNDTQDDIRTCEHKGEKL